MDFLTPNSPEARARLKELLNGLPYEESGDIFVMKEPQAKRLSDQMDAEGLDCDWGAISCGEDDDMSLHNRVARAEYDLLPKGWK